MGRAVTDRKPTRARRRRPAVTIVVLSTFRRRTCSPGGTSRRHLPAGKAGAVSALTRSRGAALMRMSPPEGLTYLPVAPRWYGNSAEATADDWVRAEHRGDLTILDRLLDDHVVAVDSGGHILDKAHG